MYIGLRRMQGVRRFILGTNLKQFHRISYLLYGNPSAATKVLCCHGLTRNATDFENLAQGLMKQFGENNIHISSIDIAGRGKSDWFKDNKDYNFTQYVNDINCWINHIFYKNNNNNLNVTWVGTSMRGSYCVHFLFYFIVDFSFLFCFVLYLVTTAVYHQNCQNTCNVLYIQKK